MHTGTVAMLTGGGYTALLPGCEQQDEEPEPRSIIRYFKRR